MNHYALYLLVVQLTLAPPSLLAAADITGAVESGSAALPYVLDLSGPWTARLDPEDRGRNEFWYAVQADPGKAVHLPGSTDTNGLGEPPSKPSNMNPQRRRVYEGAVWYARDVEVPHQWKDRRILLHLERCHWRTEVWWSDPEVQPGRRVWPYPWVGEQDSLSTPHVYDVTAWVRPGKRQRLAIRVDNREHVRLGNNEGDSLGRPYTHAYGDDTQSNWNGIVGDLRLEALPLLHLGRIRITPQEDLRQVRIEMELVNIDRSPRAASIEVQVAGTAACATAEIEAVEPLERCALEVDLGPTARPWSEFDPHLYTLVCRIRSPAGEDRREIRFGLRHVAVHGKRILLNGKPIFLRGTVDSCCFPATGYPPTDVEAWRRIYRVMKEHGLNHVRFHSWCPPAAAFTAADEEGLYLHVEGPAWSKGHGQDSQLDRYLLDEAERISDTYGNHPSFLFQLVGNEPAGPCMEVALQRWVEHMRRYDPRRLYSTGAGRAHLAVNDFHSAQDLRIPSLGGRIPCRIQNWGQGLAGPMNLLNRGTRTDFSAAEAATSKPIIAHETTQWCVYPDYRVLDLYHGVLRHTPMELARADAERKGLLPQAEEFLRASGRLALLCHKEDVESQLRTAGRAGFQLLALADYPGGGFAPVGLLNESYGTKDIHRPEEYRAFCGPTVPLARFDRWVWRSHEQFVADLEVAHFGREPLPAARLHWWLEADKKRLDEGWTKPIYLALANGQSAGSIAVRLDHAPVPCQATLHVQVVAADGALLAHNHWDLWLYPEKLPDPQGTEKVMIAKALDAAARKHLAAGGRLLLTPGPEGFAETIPGGFTPVFWNQLWAKGQQPETLGLLVRDNHAALATFPTRGHSDWQWHEVVLRARPIVIDRLPQLSLIVQPIDDWNRHRRLALVFEAAVGSGHVVATSVDFSGNLDERPVTRQLRHSLLAYLARKPPRPAAAITVDQLQTILRE